MILPQSQLHVRTASQVRQTFEEELLRSVEEFVFHFGTCDRIEPSHADDLFYAVSAAIVCVRVGAQHRAEKRL